MKDSLKNKIILNWIEKNYNDLNRIRITSHVDVMYYGKNGVIWMTYLIYDKRVLFCEKSFLVEMFDISIFDLDELLNMWYEKIYKINE